mmetsp:Transcript_20499/g.35237  ORF Transcript_20499/g.35237 Transcript_20499/m.35237 type:complete len:83 (-) Transcript_20499:62-310(-)
MPLVHPSTTPKQPSGNSGNNHNDIGNVGIVLRQPARQAGGEYETEEDGAEDEVEERSGGYLGWYRHGCLLFCCFGSFGMYLG